jgi:serine protease Do
VRSLLVAALSIGTAVTAAAGGCGVPDKSTTPQRMTPKQIVETSKPAIVRIEAGSDRVGTGFVIDASGVIATNLHVVAGQSDIKVRTLDGTTLTVPRVLALDPDHDLALLDVDPRSPLPILRLGDSDKVAAGDPVIAIGNPLGVLDYTVSDGLISSVRQIPGGLTLLQISAPISQGSSGGPLFNSFGEVIGVATAIFDAGQNLNFGVPSNYVRTLEQSQKPMTVVQFAELTRPKDHVIESGDKKIVRKVPHHDLSIFDKCKPEQIADAVQAISQAIELGAPLYNQGNHEACYRIYEGTSMRFERESTCQGVRDAFGAGLLRASTVESFTEKAWALRDMFDGLLDVSVRYAKRNAGGGSAP